MLIDRHFNKAKLLNKKFNWSTQKISYSSMNNFTKITLLITII